MDDSPIEYETSLIQHPLNKHFVKIQIKKAKAEKKGREAN
jgi:hypothetical protein